MVLIGSSIVLLITRRHHESGGAGGASWAGLVYGRQVKGGGPISMRKHDSAGLDAAPPVTPGGYTRIL